MPSSVLGSSELVIIRWILPSRLSTKNISLVKQNFIVQQDDKGGILKHNYVHLYFNRLGRLLRLYLSDVGKEGQLDWNWDWKRVWIVRRRICRENFTWRLSALYSEIWRCGIPHFWLHLFFSGSGIWQIFGYTLVFHGSLGYLANKCISSHLVMPKIHCFIIHLLVISICRQHILKESIRVSQKSKRCKH